jgi:hypothetical protein
VEKLSEIEAVAHAKKKARDKAALEEHFWPETELLTSRSLEEMQQQAEDDEA